MHCMLFRTSRTRQIQELIDRVHQPHPQRTTWLQRIPQRLLIGKLIWEGKIRGIILAEMRTDGESLNEEDGAMQSDHSHCHVDRNRHLAAWKLVCDEKWSRSAHLKWTQFRNFGVIQPENSGLARKTIASL